MAVRRAQRWDTKFGRWMGSYGVRNLASALSASGCPITPVAAYEWLAGRSSPRPQTAAQIQRLSGGIVRPEDIAAHRDLVKS